MDVEVEVVSEQRSTYLVQGVRSLERAEKIALHMAAHKLAARSRPGGRRLGSRDPEFYVEWSTPVIEDEV